MPWAQLRELSTCRCLPSGDPIISWAPWDALTTFPLAIRGAWRLAHRHLHLSQKLFSLPNIAAKCHPRRPGASETSTQGGRVRKQRPSGSPKALDTSGWITCVGLFCITSAPLHYHFMSSQGKPLCVCLTSPLLSTLHLQLKCFDYPELVTQFSSLCHFLNEDFYSFCSVTTALDSTWEKREKAHGVVSHSALTTESAQSSKQEAAHVQREADGGCNEKRCLQIHLMR